MGTTQQPRDKRSPRGPSHTRRPSGSALSRAVGAIMLLASQAGHLYGIEPSFELLGAALVALTGRDGIEFLRLIRGGGRS